MYRKHLRLVLGFFVLIFLLGSLLIVGMIGSHKPAQAGGTSSDWSTYLYGPDRTGFNSAETIINPGSAGGLKQLWSITEGTTINTQPVVANGKIYWGSWDGIEHATNLNGTQAWATNLGTVTSASCGGAGLGISSSSTIATVTINGTATSVDFVGGGNTQFYALNAATGAVIWHTPVGAVPNNVIWASPLFYNGSVYISTASLCDNPLTQGQIFQINAASGAIQNTFNVVPNGCGGGGVWGSETLDPSNGTMYFVTGTISSCSPAESMAYAIVQVNASNLSLVGFWQVPASQLGPDSDFGSTPTLFTATIGGTVHRMVGAANKNGIYYAFDEANISKGPVWQDTIAVGGPGPEKGDGSISPSAWDGTTLYVGGGNTTINGQNCQGGLRALNPATGAIIWAQCMTDGPIMGSVTLVPGIVAVTEGTAVWLMATSDGHTLFKTWDTSANSKFYGGPTISGGVLYVANKDGKFFAYGTGSAPPPPSPTPTLPPVTNSPVSKQWYFAEGRVGAGFKEWLTLGNPTTNPCTVNIQYLYTPDGGGALTKSVSVSVPAAERVTEWVDGDLGTTPTGPGITDSAIVTVNNNASPNCTGIVAERPMYFNSIGNPLGANSGHDMVGITHLGTTFYIADVGVGAQPGGGKYSSFIAILNPPGAATAQVTATYFANGQQVGSQQATVPGGTRGTITPGNASPALPGHVSVVVTSTQPVVVERPTYFTGINGGNAGIVSGAADVVGAQSLASDWLFAEGYTGGRFQENFVIANLDPGKTTANVTINLEYTDGTTHAFQVTVGPQSQLNWNVNTNGTNPSSQSVSAEITSTGAKIVVEREMFFQYSHVANGRTLSSMGGTDVMGQIGPAAVSSYSFAEGYTNVGYDEWLTVQNPTGNTETINISLLNGMGKVYTFAITVVAHSRYTVDIVAMVLQHLYQSGQTYQAFEVSMALQSSTGPFVAERPLYWNTSGTQGATDVLGYAGN